ncbi:unknown [Feldmannia species virus]|uniref:Uncharacterized protein n=1 Tax=Feldmannia species virus TaxID=39420 RepID=B5LWF3_9PHYC|nr:hypothetical protein FeldSpV_gp064 [Feldmannia species virus]ACH46816.1 unknown [Feldmannia species virus]
MRDLVIRGLNLLWYKATLFLANLRHKYKWECRSHLVKYRPLQKVLDRLFKLDHRTCIVDCPSSVAESVHISQASLIVEGKGSRDVTTRANEIKNREFSNTIFKKSGRVNIHLEDLVPDPNTCKTFWLDITYRGHADTANRLPAKTFGVKYAGRHDKPLVFPPYGANSTILSGLGAPKVILGVTDDSEARDVTETAKQYAGLYGNFYEDHIDSQILKFHITESAPCSVKVYGDGKTNVLKVKCEC